MESRRPQFWAWFGALVTAVLSGASAPWWWPQRGQDEVSAEPHKFPDSPPAANAIGIHPVIIAALSAHGVGLGEVGRYWHQPTKEADELRTSQGLLVGQRFGDGRYVVARAFSHRNEFIPVIGGWASRAERVVQGNEAVSSLVGIRPLHALIAQPDSFAFAECYKPGTVSCN